MGPYNKYTQRKANRPVLSGEKNKGDNHPRYAILRHGLFLHETGIWTETQTGIRQFHSFGSASAASVLFRGCRVICLNPEKVVD